MKKISFAEPRLIDADNLNNCPQCGTPVDYIEFIPAHGHIISAIPDHKGSYYISCYNYDCGFVLADENKERLIEAWNNWSDENEN